jgi:hypothetical protein
MKPFHLFLAQKNKLIHILAHKKDTFRKSNLSTYSWLKEYPCTYLWLTKIEKRYSRK